MHLQFHPAGIILFANTIICLVLALLVWARRVKPGGVTFGLLMLSLSVWSLCAALEDGSLDVAFKITCSKLSYLGIATSPALLLMFALDYSRHSDWFKTRNLVLLWIIPIISIGMAFTNEKHWLLWSSVIPSAGTEGEYLIYNHGIYFWFHVAFSYACMLTASILMVRTALFFPKQYRSQAYVLFFASIIPWIGNLIYISGLSPIKGLDLTPLSFSLSAIILGWSIFRMQLFGIIPIAREMVVENMNDGVIVLDNENRILDTNPAAAKLIFAEKENLLGRKVEEALKDYPDILTRFRGVQEGRVEIELHTQPLKYLDVNITPLYDQNNQINGRIFILRDITSRKKIEQDEREQRLLASSLSDSATALNSLRDVNDVLDRILLDVQNVFSHDTASIALLDDKNMVSFVRFRFAKNRGLGEVLSKLKLDVDNVYTFKTMLRTKKPIVIADTTQDPRWIPIKNSEWINSMVGVPIMIGGKVIGFLNLDSSKANFFTQKSAVWLQAFADHAGVAIENARLFEQVSRNAKEMSTFYHAGLVLSTNLNLNQMIMELYEQCSKIADIERFNLALYEEQTGTVKFHIITSKVKRIRTRIRNIIEKPGMTNHIIQTQKSVYMADVLDPINKKYKNIWNRLNKKEGRSYLAVPLKLRGRVIGVLSVQSKKIDAYDSNQIRMIETFATQTSAAIENALLFKQKERLAITDGLTGLFNHRYFSELAEKELSRAVRYQKPLSFIMIDLDFFKQVNDNFGHLKGDQILQQISKNCLKILRKIDIISRYGGEEFCVLLPETDIKEAVAVAERLREAIGSSQLVTKEGVVKVTGSLGVSSLGMCEPEIKNLIDCADKALYEAKKAGRNQVKVFKPDKQFPVQ
jgi:diguanylate cyclase (GGDEF)-like protein/PAS domain S-box-containing protein